MLPQCGYGRLLLQRKLLRPPKSFFHYRAHGAANFGLSPKIEFFNGMGQFRRSARVPHWSGEPQRPDMRSALRHFGVAAQADLPRFAKKGNYKNILGRRKAA